MSDEHFREMMAHLSTVLESMVEMQLEAHSKIDALHTKIDTMIAALAEDHTPEADDTPTLDLDGDSAGQARDIYQPL